MAISYHQFYVDEIFRPIKSFIICWSHKSSVDFKNKSVLAKIVNTLYIYIVLTERFSSAVSSLDSRSHTAWIRLIRSLIYYKMDHSSPIEGTFKTRSLSNKIPSVENESKRNWSLITPLY